MSNIDFTPAQIKATGVRPNSVRSALTSNAKHKEMTVKKKQTQCKKANPEVHSEASQNVK